MSKGTVFCLALSFLLIFAHCNVAIAKGAEKLQTEVRVFKMNYAQASELVEAVKMMLSERGSAVAYSPTNSIVVVDTPDRIAQVEKFIAQMDTKIEGVATEEQTTSAGSE